jgi:hypothetical protein
MHNCNEARATHDTCLNGSDIAQPNFVRASFTKSHDNFGTAIPRIRRRSERDADIPLMPCARSVLEHHTPSTRLVLMTDGITVV